MVRDLPRGVFRQCIETALYTVDSLNAEERAALRVVANTATVVGTNFGDPAAQPCCPASLAGLDHGLIGGERVEAARDFAYAYDDALIAYLKDTMGDPARFWNDTDYFRVTV